MFSLQIQEFNKAFEQVSDSLFHTETKTTYEYVDPRILVAFTKKHGLDLNAIGYTSKASDPITWAKDVDASFRY